MNDVVDVVLNNEMRWDETWVAHFQKYASAFHFTPSVARDIRTKIAAGVAVPMSQGNDCYEIKFNGNLAGLIMVRQYIDEENSAEIDITTLDDYRGHHLAEIAIEKLLKETKYSTIVGFVYDSNSCKAAINHIFKKLGFTSELKLGGTEWSKEVVA